MSPLLRAAVLVVVAGLLTACSGSESGLLGGAEDLGTSSSAPRQGADSPDPRAEPSACDEVVAGIEAFNRGDFDETVASFERAVPVAQAEDDAADSRRSDDLLEAVRYYADLAPEDYPRASVDSPDFARYKAITLGQCGAGEPQAPPDPEGGGGIPA